MSDHIDEMSNEDLARLGHSAIVMQYELERVERVVKSHVMSGADLAYWHDRARILRKLLHEGARSPFLR